MTCYHQKAENHHARIMALITILQHPEPDIDLVNERFDTLEILKGLMPTIEQIRVYMTVEAEGPKGLL